MNSLAKSFFSILLVLIIAGCAGTPGGKYTYTDIDILIEEAAWETIDILWETLDILPAGKLKTLVVYYFTEEGDKSPLSDYLIQGLTTEIANAIRYEEIDVKIVSRQSLDRIIDELAFQTSDLADQDTQLSIGKQLGADIILTGTITPELSIYKLNAQLIEVETGIVHGGFIMNFQSESDLEIK